MIHTEQCEKGVLQHCKISIDLPVNVGGDVVAGIRPFCCNDEVIRRRPFGIPGCCVTLGREDVADDVMDEVDFDLAVVSLVIL